MAYQNVGIPRFYCDLTSFLLATGAIELVASNSMSLGDGSFTNDDTYYGLGGDASALTNLRKILGLNPSSPVELTGFTGVNRKWINIRIPHFNLFPQNSNGTINSYVAILGHNFHSANLSRNYAEWATPIENTSEADADDDDTYIVNTTKPISYNGFTIWTNSNLPSPEYSSIKVIVTNKTSATTDNEILQNPKIGCISQGTYYDMPHSPDLKLTMTREMDGVKRIRTKGGADLVDHKYTKPPKWGGLGAWELSTSSTGYPPALSRSGRRVWDLSFSYLDSSDLFGSNQSQGSKAYTPTGYELGDLDANNNFEFNILTDQNFYSQVIHKTNGGQLPFIFQPDGDGDTPGSGNNNPDQFAICKLDMKSFKFSQKSFNTYNLSLKIREVW